jgi:hypothetical protein
MIRQKNLFHIGILLLLFIAFLGPWGYHHHSPLAEWCQKPFLLLENGSCAGRQPGTFFLLFAAVSFPVLILGLFSRGSTLPDLLLVSRGTLMFLIMFCMPVISTFLLMRSSASHKHRTFSVIAWGLAATLGTFLALSAEVIHPAQLWGIWARTPTRTSVSGRMVSSSSISATKLSGTACGWSRSPKTTPLVHAVVTVR